MSSDYSIIFAPQTWHRPYSDVVNLINSLDSDSDVLIDHKVRGQLTSIHGGQGIKWQFSNQMGQGSMQHALLDEEVLLQACNFKLKEAITVNVHRDNYIAFVVVLEGVDNDEQRMQSDLANNFCIMSTAHESERISMHFPSAKWIQTVAIMLPVSRLSSVLGLDMSYVQEELALGYESWSHGNSHYAFFNANVHAIKCAAEMLNVNYSDPLHKEYIRLASRELLCHLLASWDRSASIHESPYRYSLADREALEFAKKIVESDILEPPSIASLATQVGLSENKLTYGFRYIYGQSVHNFLVDLRMSKSMKLLTQTQHSVEEIAMMVGYKGSSGFIKAFKNRFGVTPLKVRTM